MTRFLTSYVHIEGVAYPAGMSEAEVGPAAGQIGDHAWRVVDDGPPAAVVAASPGLEPVESVVVPEVEPSSPADVVEDPELAEPGVVPAGEGEQSSDPAPPPEDAPKPPPHSGKGSSESAWREYALKVGVHTDDANDRAEVIALIEAAGKPV